MKKCVLIVEDDHDIRVAIRLVFEDLDFHVLSAANGLDALKIMESQKPHLIILDLMMPLMNGEEFLLVKNANAEWAPIPVFVMSAFENNLNKIVNLPKVKKPFDLTSFANIAKQTLD